MRIRVPRNNTKTHKQIGNQELQRAHSAPYPLLYSWTCIAIGTAGCILALALSEARNFPCCSGHLQIGTAAASPGSSYRARGVMHASSEEQQRR
jgi:hypothetical protein